jgi:phosphoserine aminotransferase
MVLTEKSYLYLSNLKTMKKHNFSAGPAILPQSVLEKAAESARNYDGTGLSLLEMSHRGPEFTEILHHAVQRVFDLTGLGDDYAVLYLSGGASTQFFMAPMNLLPQNGKAAYLNTGRWADKAIDEAKMFGSVDILADSKASNFDHIPKGYEINEHYNYLHYTSNNTVSGSQFHELPSQDQSLICDMSSDIFSRPLEFNKFDLIYAGAQKNLGPAGTTLVIIRKDILGKVKRAIPTMLDYRTHIKKNSSFNTPPVFPIYVCMLTMDWIIEKGGLLSMKQRNEDKAQLLYSEIDRNALFEGIVAKEDRSLMNATFNLKNNDSLPEFLEKAKAAGCVGLKGHRSVGGLRASMYNAMEIESVQVLVDVMKDFENEKG